MAHEPGRFVARMSLGSEHLERLADDAYGDRLISSATFCGQCGYNLRTLPYIYNCPECGQAYNARPLKMKGIFVPIHLTFPIMNLVSTVFSGLMAAMIFNMGWQPKDPTVFIFAAIFAVFAIIYAARWIGQLKDFVNYRRIISKIEEEEESEWITPHR